RLRQETPEVADERLPAFCRVLQRLLGVPQDAQLLRREIRLGERRRPGVATLAQRHRMQRPLWRRLQHHEDAAAVADLAAGVVDQHAAAAGAPVTLAEETMTAGSRADGAG